MSIKKSGFILLLFACCSIGLLVFTSYKSDIANNEPAKKVPLKCSQECNGAKSSSPWNILSYSIIPSEG